ncbi:MAG: IPT/TIG domain-containing protein, partial [Candidatus Kapabacteria bacterium]|nr:IPT/TIG domain-containing protein [Candidatus Kapabacteria bacterium]
MSAALPSFSLRRFVHQPISALFCMLLLSIWATVLLPLYAQQEANAISLYPALHLASADASSIAASRNALGIGITSFSPSSINAGTNGFQLRIYLSGRVSQTIPTANFGSVPVSVIESNLNDILVDVPASAIADAGTYQVSVTDPATGTTGYANFNVIQQSNPTPTVGVLQPPSVQAGSGSFSLVINGRGFVSGVTQFTFNGLPLTNPSTLGFTYAVFTVPASYITNTGTIQISAVNPTPGGGWGSNTFTITAPALPAPSISSFTPTQLIANGYAQTLTIYGNNFRNPSVTFNGSGVSITSNGSNTLTISIP